MASLWPFLPPRQRPLFRAHPTRIPPNCYARTSRSPVHCKVTLRSMCGNDSDPTSRHICKFDSQDAVLLLSSNQLLLHSRFPCAQSFLPHRLASYTAPISPTEDTRIAQAPSADATSVRHFENPVVPRRTSYTDPRKPGLCLCWEGVYILIQVSLCAFRHLLLPALHSTPSSLALAFRYRALSKPPCPRRPCARRRTLGYHSAKFLHFPVPLVLSCPSHSTGLAIAWPRLSRKSKPMISIFSVLVFMSSPDRPTKTELPCRRSSLWSRALCHLLFRNLSHSSSRP